MKPEILLNATLINTIGSKETYEFVIDIDLKVLECLKLGTMQRPDPRPIANPSYHLHNHLFELNHVRVNPNIDNTAIITKIVTEFQKIGVRVHNTPNSNSMAVCFKPLGELSANIRFYIGNLAQAVFLSPQNRPNLVVHTSNY